MANINMNQRSAPNSQIARWIALALSVILIAINVVSAPTLIVSSDSEKPQESVPVEQEPEDSYWTEIGTAVTETDIYETEISETDVSETDVEELTVYDIDLPYFITIDKVGQVVSIYTTNEEGKYETLVRQCICSTGEKIDKLPDGYYPLKKSKHKWQTMLSHGDPLYAQYTTQITGSFLFHSVPYTATKKNALDMTRYKNLGKANSGGCIRLTVECAKWIYDNCPAGTPVYVFKGKYDADLIAKLKPPTPKGGWDPTDPDPDNPYYQPQYDESSEPKPYVYAPLYDYDFDWAPECERIFYTEADDTEETTVSTESTESTESAESTDVSESTQATESTESTTASGGETTTTATAAETTTTTVTTTTTTTTAAPTTTTTTTTTTTAAPSAEGE